MLCYVNFTTREIRLWEIEDGSCAIYFPEPTAFLQINIISLELQLIRFMWGLSVAYSGNTPVFERLRVRQCFLEHSPGITCMRVTRVLNKMQLPDSSQALSNRKCLG